MNVTNETEDLLIIMKQIEKNIISLKKDLFN